MGCRPAPVHNYSWPYWEQLPCLQRNLLAMTFTGTSRNFQDKALDMCRYEGKQNFVWREQALSRRASWHRHSESRRSYPGLILPSCRQTVPGIALDQSPGGSLGQILLPKDVPLQSDTEANTNLSSTCMLSRGGCKYFQGT